MRITGPDVAVRLGLPEDTTCICDECGDPHVFTRVSTEAGLVGLCYGCTQWRWPGVDIELHHAAFSDYIEDKAAAQLKRDGVIKP